MHIGMWAKLFCYHRYVLCCCLMIIQCVWKWQCFIMLVLALLLNVIVDSNISLLLNFCDIWEVWEFLFWKCQIFDVLQVSLKGVLMLSYRGSHHGHWLILFVVVFFKKLNHFMSVFPFYIGDWIPMFYFEF